MLTLIAEDKDLDLIDLLSSYNDKFIKTETIDRIFETKKKNVISVGVMIFLTGNSLTIKNEIIYNLKKNVINVVKKYLFRVCGMLALILFFYQVYKLKLFILASIRTLFI